MTATPPRFVIVVGIDLSEQSDAVLEQAFDEALRHERPSLHVVTVSDDRDPAAVQLVTTLRRALADAVPQERRADWTILVHVRSGPPEKEIVDLAAEVLAARIVVGRFGIAARARHDITSIADLVVALADCPVLVVPAPRAMDASARQCPACVEVRRASAGEQWFCAEHHSQWSRHLIVPMPVMDRAVGGSDAGS